MIFIITIVAILFGSFVQWAVKKLKNSGDAFYKKSPKSKHFWWDPSLSTIRTGSKEKERFDLTIYLKSLKIMSFHIILN